MNLCRSCNQDFTGVKDFDHHRVGKHAYTFQEGLRMNPSVEDGRRCLDIEEMQKAGWSRDRFGRWQRRRQKAPDRFQGSLRIDRDALPVSPDGSSAQKETQA